MYPREGGDLFLINGRADSRFRKNDLMADAEFSVDSAMGRDMDTSKR